MNRSWNHEAIQHRSRVLTLVAAILTLGLMIGIAVFGRGAISVMGEIHRSWDTYSHNSEKTGHLLQELKGTLGYGGFIHHFKNYVLRQDDHYANTAEAKLNLADLLLTEYETLANAPPERDALTAIRETLAHYRETLIIARHAVAAGEDPAAIDWMVKVEDDDAFAALATLEKAWQRDHDVETEKQEAAVASGLKSVSIGVALMLTLIAAAFGALWLQRRLMKETMAVTSRLDTVVNTAFEGIITADMNGRIRRFNSAAEKMFGYQADEIEGKSIGRLMPRPDALRHDVFLKGHVPANNWTMTAGFDRETRARHKDGTTFPVEVAVKATEVVGERSFTAVIRDISARVEAQRRLRISEERQSLVINGVNDGIWDWDIVGGALYVSDRFLTLLGYEPGSLRITAAGWVQRIHPAHREKQCSRLIDHFKGKLPIYTCEYQVANRDGDYIWVLDRGMAIFDEKGRAYRMAGSISDVTARRTAEDNLRHTQKMEAVGQLAAGVAHEFNNLLVGIGGFAAMAKDSTDDAGTLDTCLEEIDKAVVRANGLTRDLLSFSRDQDVATTLMDISMNDLVTDAENLLRMCSGGDVELLLEPSKDDLVVTVDPSHLAQVITNFAINGRDAMPQGGVLKVGAKLSRFTANDAARHPGASAGIFASVYVSDTGTGIPEEVRQRLFEPFFSTKETGKGTGLGLAIAHGIVERAGGFISVDSTVGQGSVFAINLPLPEQNTTVAEPTAAAAGR